MTCTICHHPANLTWHGQPICTACRDGVSISRPMTRWVLAACVVVIIVCLISIGH